MAVTIPTVIEVAVTNPAFIVVAVTTPTFIVVAVTIPTTIFGVPIKLKDEVEIPEVDEYCDVN